MEQTNDAWIAMFRRLPGVLHETLAVMLRTGTEIVVQRIVKLEPDFAIIRGRISGTQDNWRIVLIPYSQMVFASVTKALKDPELDAIFGKGAPPALADLPTVAAATMPDAALTETPIDEPEAPEPEPAPKRPEPPSKSALVAKLRQQLKEPK